MTAAELFAMPARDLDTIVAAIVMGWKLTGHGDYLLPDGACVGTECLPSYSMDGQAMIDVLARLHDLHPNWRVEIETPHENAGIIAVHLKGRPGEVNFLAGQRGCIARVPFVTVAELPRAVAVAAVLAMEEKP